MYLIPRKEDVKVDGDRIQTLLNDYRRAFEECKHLSLSQKHRCQYCRSIQREITKIRKFTNEVYVNYQQEFEHGYGRTLQKKWIIFRNKLEKVLLDKSVRPLPKELMAHIILPYLNDPKNCPE